MNLYQNPMPPYPGWESWVQRVSLPKSDVELFTYDAGPRQAETILLLHGLGDEADTWRGQLPALAECNRVIAIDLPGFGRSSKPARRYDMAFFQQTLLELVNRLELGRFRLVGHSLGAMIAHQFALQHPERISRLTLISGSLLVKVQGLSLGALLMLAPGLGEWSYNRLRGDAQKAYQTLEPYYANLAALPEAERAFLYERVNQRVWDDAQRSAYLSAYRSLAGWISGQQRRLAERLGAWRTPTQVLWGALDRISSPENGRLLAAMQPRTEFKLIAGAGHNLQQDAPEQVLNGIRR